jgi:ribonuclease Z
MKAELRIIGCYASTPRSITNPTAQVLRIGKESFLIDCGEGTQKEMRRMKVKMNGIDRVFISHLHGDHFYGLPGLVNTMAALGRTAPLHIYGPKGIKEVLTSVLKSSSSWTSYPLHFIELDQKDAALIYESDTIRVHTLPLKHRIYTNGFLFEVLKEEEGWRRFYAYCSDTSYNEALIDLISDSEVLYHESTFLKSELLLCEKTGHSTAFQAGQIAQKSRIKTLILGHYSTRYKSLDAFREEASEVFPSECIELADDYKVFSLNI